MPSEKLEQEMCRCADEEKIEKRKAKNENRDQSDNGWL
jgi:hypothetical protein